MSKFHCIQVLSEQPFTEVKIRMLWENCLDLHIRIIAIG